MRHARHFIFLALSWAWLWWWLNVGFGLGAASSFGRITIALGGISPALAALVLLYRHAGRLERTDFLRRIWETGPVADILMLILWFIAAIWATQKYPAILLKPQPQ